MGADRHIADPDDRAELVARAYELYGQYGSLRKVREHLAVDPITVGICGEPRHFAIDTIRTWIDEGRTAEGYVELLNLARERRDSHTRLSLLAATMWEHLRIRHGSLSTTDLVNALDFMRKVESDRATLLGLRAPIKVAQVEPESGAIPADMVAAVDALARRVDAERRSLHEDEHPDAAIAPIARLGRRPRRRPRSDGGDECAP